jgi:hypothetical protein
MKNKTLKIWLRRNGLLCRKYVKTKERIRVSHTIMPDTWQYKPFVKESPIKDEARVAFFTNFNQKLIDEIRINNYVVEFKRKFRAGMLKR